MLEEDSGKCSGKLSILIGRILRKLSDGMQNKTAAQVLTARFLHERNGNEKLEM